MISIIFSQKEMKEFSNCGSCPICSIPLVQGKGLTLERLGSSYLTLPTRA